MMKPEHAKTARDGVRYGMSSRKVRSQKSGARFPAREQTLPHVAGEPACRRSWMVGVLACYSAPGAEVSQIASLSPDYGDTLRPPRYVGTGLKKAKSSAESLAQQNGFRSIPSPTLRQFTMPPAVRTAKPD